MSLSVPSNDTQLQGALAGDNMVLDCVSALLSALTRSWLCRLAI